MVGRPTPGPGWVAYAGLQQSIPTRDPNLEPRRETMCLLVIISSAFDLLEDEELTEYGMQPYHGDWGWHL